MSYCLAYYRNPKEKKNSFVNQHKQIAHILKQKRHAYRSYYTSSLAHK